MKIISSILLLLGTNNAYDENSCAYFTTHVIASPLSTCSGVSIPDSQKYSWNFECDANGDIMCNYFLGDTQCNQAAYAGSTGVDTLAGGAQCMGSGANCHTVDITVKGYTNPTDDCSAVADDDFTTYSFVIEECIPSTMGGAQSSAKMSCNDKELFFEYYSDSNDCTGNVESYTYEYYADLHGSCWDIQCGLHREEGQGDTTPIEGEQPPLEAPACELEVESLEYMGHNHKEMGRKLVEMLTKPNLMEMTLAKYHESKTKAFAANVINGGEWDAVERKSGFVVNRLIMNWIYIVAVACAVILVAGAWRFIKQKEYTIL